MVEIAAHALRAVPPIAARPRRGCAEEDAAAALYRELAPAVLGYLRSQRPPEAEDLLAEVFFDVARDIDRVRGDPEARRRWVFTVAHHRLVDAWRRCAARPPTRDALLPDQPVDDHLESVDPALQTAIDALTEDQRAVVLLRFVADLSLEDVARITHRRVGAVKALQHRGLAALAHALAGSRPFVFRSPRRRIGTRRVQRPVLR